MKILFVTSALGIDYLQDCIFHGLVSLGHEVIDSKYLWYLSQPLSDDKRKRLYGKGFTLSGTLSDRSNIDRSNIEQKIKDKYFDCIIYGSVMRSLDYFDVVCQNYPKSKIIFCNGEDDVITHDQFIQHGICFKRELVSTKEFPISFAIPEEKLCTIGVVKTRFLAEMIPGTATNRKYIYDNEADYYKGYQDALFGLTMKKAGWDCLRHYEIIANKCLPYFQGFEQCPKTIMANWPVDLQLAANNMFETKNIDGYEKLLTDFFIYCKNNLTTKHLAQYILSKLN